MKNRIKELRTLKGLTCKQLADIIGTSDANISRVENGQRRLDLNWMKKISKALSVKPVELLPLEWQPKGINTINVVGHVQAGQWQEAGQWDPSDFYQIAIPDYSAYEGKHLYALEVRGESMNKVFPNGTCVVCVPINEWDEKIENGKRVIVERKNPKDLTVEATVKEYIKNESGTYLVPQSTDPSFSSIKIDETTGESAITGVVIGSFRRE